MPPSWSLHTGKGSASAHPDKQGKEAYVTSDGTKHEVTRNLADRHDYIVIFDREGNYKKKLQIEDTFAVQRVAAFPSSAFLVFGFDKQDHSPRLALLQEDAKFLRFLELPKDIDLAGSLLWCEDPNPGSAECGVRSAECKVPIRIRHFKVKIQESNNRVRCG